VPPAPLNYPDEGNSAGYAAVPQRAPTPLGQYASNDRSIPEQFRMVTSPSGRDFIRGREGPGRPQTYPDIANHPTIGFGHNLTPGDTWLYQQFPNGIDPLMADTLFNQDLQNAEDAVYHAVGNADGLSQNQFDSLASFAFNVGRGNLANSTLAQKIKNRDLAGAANEFSKWVYAGGAKSQGLIDWRAREDALFRRGIY
jgi:lysozyme